MSLIEYIFSVGGVAGVLAVLMWLNNRSLVNQMIQDRKFMEDRLTQIIGDYNRVCERQWEAITTFTGVLSELKIWLEARNGKRS